jgi:hypothetical protein
MGEDLNTSLTGISELMAYSGIKVKQWLYFSLSDSLMMRPDRPVAQMVQLVDLI